MLHLVMARCYSPCGRQAPQMQRRFRWGFSDVEGDSKHPVHPKIWWRANCYF